VKRLLLLTALVLGGCGASRIIVTVDAASFLSEADLNPSYAALPGVPPVSLRFGPDTVEIPEGLGDVADVEEADMTVRAVVRNASGTGQLTLRMFFAAAGEDPFATPPVAVFPAVLAPGDSVLIEETTELTEPVRELFTEASVQFAYELVVDGSGSAVPVQGTVEMQEIAVRVVHDPNLGS
jgi:hypothetical protein